MSNLIDNGNLPNKVIEERICTCCGKQMDEGFVINGGEEYYCSEDCLYTVYTRKEYMKMYDNGTSETYWTKWEPA